MTEEKQISREDKLTIIHALKRRAAILSSKYDQADRIANVGIDKQMDIDIENCARLTMVRQQIEKMWEL